MKPIIRLKKIREQGNYLKADTLDIHVFNYDGRGSAIVRIDGSVHFDCLHRNDLDFALFGNPHSRERFYAVEG